MLFPFIISWVVTLFSSNAAKQLVHTVFDKISRLEVHPDLGEVPAKLSHLIYKELIVNPCRIFYKVESNRVYCDAGRARFTTIYLTTTCLT
ncbi:type II toxin-antitoxin system RelE/ParE family toxin [Colwellia sp. RE-S-Sl-9]